MRKFTIVIVYVMLITTFSCIFPIKISVAAPPYVPSYPDPENNSNDVSIETNLSWTGGDPDGDIVIYYVYFGKDSPPPLNGINIPVSKYTLDTLDYNTQYYWQIVAWDSSTSSPGPIWKFTTELQQN